MQHVENAWGHQQPQYQVTTVHLTFQYSDTPDFPHGGPFERLSTLSEDSARSACLAAATAPSSLPLTPERRLPSPRRRGRASQPPPLASAWAAEEQGHPPSFY